MFYVKYIFLNFLCPLFSVALQNLREFISLIMYYCMKLFNSKFFSLGAGNDDLQSERKERGRSLSLTA